MKSKIVAKEERFRLAKFLWFKLLIVCILIYILSLLTLSVLVVYEQCSLSAVMSLDKRFHCTNLEGGL